MNTYKHNTVYKITNLVNGKIYIGMHQTNDIDDGYMGSGKQLKRAIKKYGVDNFRKEIIHDFDNIDDMQDAERNLVTTEFVNRSDTYNLIEGGGAKENVEYVNRRGLNLYGMNGKTPNIKDNFSRGRKTLAENRKDEEWFSAFKIKMSVAMRQLYENGYQNHFKGRKHTDETKKKISEKNAVYQKGEGNSQFGTRWIHSLNLKQCKKIKKNDPLPDGWKEGRKMKF
jgi:hypothetical protein